MVEIRGGDPFTSCLDAVLASQREELLIGFGYASLSGDWLMLITDARLAGDDEVRRDVRGLHWTGGLTSAMHDEARRSGRGILLLHAHGDGDEVAGLSMTDRETVEEVLPHFGMLLPDVPHAYVVVNGTHAAGWVQVGDGRRALDGIKTVTSPLRIWATDASTCVRTLARDERQAAALGEDGIGKLRRSTIGIVGMGGAGSQVAEMLAHAGVGRLVVADADKIEEVNLSRTHGTSPAMVGRMKVESVKTMVRRISPETVVDAVGEAFPTVALLGDLRKVDVLVACVDTVHSRNELNRFALRYAIPLIDLGTTITPKPFRVDGHLSLIMPGSQCLRCVGHVSDILLGEEQEAARRGWYGLNEGRPQVVSFNGLLASAAVTEALKLVTGFAGRTVGSREWHYDPVVGELRTVGLAPDLCRECSWYGMKGDQA